MITADQLLRGNILGIVSSQGEVISRFTGSVVTNHDFFWPLARCRWRWNHNSSLHWFLNARPTPEERESIEQHLTRKYGLKWWENGHHDIEDLMSRSVEALNRREKILRTPLTKPKRRRIVSSRI